MVVIDHARYFTINLNFLMSQKELLPQIRTFANLFTWSNPCVYLTFLCFWQFQILEIEIKILQTFTGSEWIIVGNARHTSFRLMSIYSSKTYTLWRKLLDLISFRLLLINSLLVVRHSQTTAFIIPWEVTNQTWSRRLQSVVNLDEIHWEILESSGSREIPKL